MLGRRINDGGGGFVEAYAEIIGFFLSSLCRRSISRWSLRLEIVQDVGASNKIYKGEQKSIFLRDQKFLFACLALLIQFFSFILIYFIWIKKKKREHRPILLLSWIIKEKGEKGKERLRDIPICISPPAQLSPSHSFHRDNGRIALENVFHWPNINS